MDKDGKQKYYIDTPVWNATVANLTLMALGSSAPEILLSVIGTLKDIEAEPPELGPSTIVGSAAFNLLVISGVSILAVGEEPKKVNDVGVFAVTSIASLFAYIWLYLTLSTISPNYISVMEAWLTLIYFFLLIILAYAADRINGHIQSKKKSQEDQERENLETEIKIKKNRLRQIARERGENIVIEIAQNIHNAETEAVPEILQREIKNLYKEILQVKDLGTCDISELLKAIQPDSLLERFAFRKAGGNNKEFIKLKGSRGQINHEVGQLEEGNELIGFKCLHYSVTESNGTVEVTIIKKVTNQELTFGYRTVADTAVPEKDYTHTNKVVTMKKRDAELKIYIPIVNDEEWNPDMDFFIELYDPAGTEENGEPPKYFGMDTKCKVTILDEDFPGSLGFDITDVRVSKGSKKVELTVVRQDGADGTIHCMIGTEALSEHQAANNAIEFEDYLPMYEKITFMHGETEKTITITLVDENIPNIQEKEIGDNQVGEEGELNNESDEECDRIFKVKLEKPEPSEVKITKKNVCMVTIVQQEDHDKAEEDRQKLIEFYMSQQDPTWAQQFKNAVMLGPQFDEDNLILEEVDAWEAFCHFTSIGWKVFLAIIPPTSIWGGKACFFSALAMIGVITGIVGEIATVLGCVAGIS